MSGNLPDRVSNRIAQKLSCLSVTFTEQCISKVNACLRSHNEQAYEPRVLSIGPYHHGNCNLKTMETYKLWYLQDLLLRCPGRTTSGYINALTTLKDQARRCYAEEIGLNEDDFVEMMFLDGCFVIEFLRKCKKSPLSSQDDPIFQMGWLTNSILRDLILFENQLPFFVLIELFDMTKSAGENQNLMDLALTLCGVLPNCGPSVSCNRISANKVIHLLDLVYEGWCSSFEAGLPDIKDSENDSSLEFIKSTSELKQSGIKFGTNEQNQSWLDITFINGEMKIPCFTVDDNTESVFRNLIAYEQYVGNRRSRSCISDYTTFLDLLIDSPRDVEKLRKYKIIKNWLGDDEAVSAMINRLGNDVTTNESKFCYRKVFKEVNKYSCKRQNIWRAHLMGNYFNTPWTIISFLAALALLILTSVQTIFSILQYVQAVRAAR